MRNTRYRRFLVMTLAPIAVLAAGCVVLALWLEPLSNDLTRLGGYPERTYGWNGDDFRFQPLLAVPARLEDYYDVVVIGDSFSIPATARPGVPRTDEGTWADDFVAQTGLSVGLFHVTSGDADAYSRSEAFRTRPPAVLVVEVAERALWREMLPEAPCVDVPRPPRVKLVARPLAQRPIAFRREIGLWIDATRIDTALDYLTKTIPRWLPGVNTTKVLRYELTRADLFSSREPSVFLALDEELMKGRRGAAILPTLGCRFLALQQRVEANGRTAFVLMIAPTRLTAYADYLPDLRLTNFTATLAETAGLNILRVDIALRRAIAAGKRDVYYPSDTHWGGAGKRIAADTLTAYLQRADFVGEMRISR